MCEFCLFPSSNANRDAQHSDFAGFFSADAIEAAVRQANAHRTTTSSNAISSASASSVSDNNNNSDDEGPQNDDDDGT